MLGHDGAEPGDRRLKRRFGHAGMRIRVDIHDVETGLRAGQVEAVDVVGGHARVSADRDLELGVDGFDGLIGDFQEVEIGGRIGLLPEAGYVLFVPDLPDRDAGLVALDELSDICFPGVEMLVRGIGEAGAVGEDRQELDTGLLGIVQRGVEVVERPGAGVRLHGRPVEIRAHAGNTRAADVFEGGGARGELLAARHMRADAIRGGDGFSPDRAGEGRKPAEECVSHR